MSANQEARGGVAYRRPGVNDALDPFAITTLIALSAIWGLGQVAVKVVNTGMQPVFQAGPRSSPASLSACYSVPNSSSSMSASTTPQCRAASSSSSSRRWSWRSARIS
jgi:hypothetical protein